MVYGQLGLAKTRKEGGDLFKVGGVKIIKNAIADIEADRITVSDEMIEELWK
jgi:hypothetical protein